MDDNAKFGCLFLYGSNLDPERLKSRIESWNGRGYPATLSKHELRFNKKLLRGGVAANVMPHASRLVWGIIVELTSSEIERMDAYEGHPDRYQRQRLSLNIVDGSLIDSFIYVAHPCKVVSGLLPEREYLGHVIRGATYWGFPPAYIRSIEALGTGKMTAIAPSL